MVEREAVLWGYRLLLGREPESEQILAAHSQIADIRDLREAFLTCTEFARESVVSGIPPLWVAAPVMRGARLMWLDLGDRYVSRGCLLDDYEPVESRFVRALLRPEDVFADVGANLGWFTLLASTIVGGSGRIYAFEPRNETADYLEKTIQLNGLQHQVTLFRCALSDTAGEAVLNWGEGTDNPGGSFLADHALPSGMISQRVALRTLDSLALERVDFMKVDVEGAELRVFRGAQSTIERCRPAILSELSPDMLMRGSGEPTSAFFAFFSAHGYRCHLLDGKRYGEEVAAFPADWPKPLLNLALLPKEMPFPHSLSQSTPSSDFALPSTGSDRAPHIGQVTQMLTHDEIVYAYRLLLGREPENQDVVDQLMSIPNWKELRKLFVASPEFQTVNENVVRQDSVYDFLLGTPGRVDIDISDEHFNRLVKHVQRAWERLGAERPHWSVLTSPDFMPEEIKTNLDRFYNSATDYWQRFERANARAGTTTWSDATAFELGCGVGRVTAALATRFRSIVACDISRPHLELAQAHLRKVGAQNVNLLHLTGLDVLESMEPFDYFYSVLVLQHNPPPLIHKILEIILKKIREGGVAYFQIPVAARSYEFSIEDYLGKVESDEPDMEMHILPQARLFRLLNNSGMRVLDFQIDGCSGPAFQSVSILAEKPREASDKENGKFMLYTQSGTMLRDMPSRGI